MTPTYQKMKWEEGIFGFPTTLLFLFPEQPTPSLHVREQIVLRNIVHMELALAYIRELCTCSWYGNKPRNCDIFMRPQVYQNVRGIDECWYKLLNKLSSLEAFPRPQFHFSIRNSMPLGRVHNYNAWLVGVTNHIPMWDITFRRAVASLAQSKLQHNLKLSRGWMRHRIWHSCMFRPTHYCITMPWIYTILIFSPTFWWYLSTCG